MNTGGHGLFDGYYNDPDADAERMREGAFWSGDLAYADAGGYVFFAGRGTERLRVDGENLAVAPIEAVLREFPGVIEAAVYPGAGRGRPETRSWRRSCSMTTPRSRRPS